MKRMSDTVIKAGKNDPCPCGSGWKYKKCCLQKAFVQTGKEESKSEETFFHFSELADLETFSPQVFKGDEQVSQDTCNFVLALGCIYNDYRDILLAEHYLEYLRPAGPFKETPAWGEYNGVKVHLMRLHLSLLHELLNLIEHSDEVLKDRFFKSIIASGLDAKGRSTWNALLNASAGKKANDKITKLLNQIRNKIAFHYDAKVFFKGYQSWFINGKKKPYISRGRKIRKITEERYYFAEACAQGYLDSLCSDKSIDPKELGNLATSLGPAISQIVVYFIDKRPGVGGLRPPF